MELAPIYDASSARRGEYIRRPALPVRNAEQPDEMQAEDMEWLMQGTAMSAEEARAVARTIVDALPDALAEAVAEAKKEDRISERHAVAGEARKRALQEETRARCGIMVMMLDVSEGWHRGSGAAGRRSNRVGVPEAGRIFSMPGRSVTGRALPLPPVRCDKGRMESR